LSRDKLLTVLAGEGVSARAGIMAAHRQPAYADHPHVDLPVTERLTDNTLILPLFHTMSEDEQATVVGAIRGAAGLGFDS
jgi:dTDP-4-amino-4,6-dideoxygalactose transaminase